jgi:hypothetical protein
MSFLQRSLKNKLQKNPCSLNLKIQICKSIHATPELPCSVEKLRKTPTAAEAQKKPKNG